MQLPGARHSAVQQGHLQGQVIHTPGKQPWQGTWGIPLELSSGTVPHMCNCLITFIHRTLLFILVFFSSLLFFLLLSNFLLTYLALFLLLCPYTHTHFLCFSLNLLLGLLISVLFLSFCCFLSLCLSLCPSEFSLSLSCLSLDKQCLRGGCKAGVRPNEDAPSCSVHQEVD